jgi:RimJ/RimL family protein N-acetyltransferase
MCRSLAFESLRGGKENKVLMIRPTEIADAFCVSACITHVAHERQFLTATAGFNPVQTSQYLELIRKKGGVHLIALAGNDVVGWCDIAPAIFEGHSQIGRLGLGLLAQHRGQGWGKKLLDRTLEAAFLKNFERVELEVFLSNQRAIKLYRSAGFREEGRKRNGRKIDGRFENILLLGLLREEWRNKQ